MSTAANIDRLDKIAEAVLYEGYMLYPYRASAVKNQQRWNFGVLCPRSWSEQQSGTESWMMQTECLLQGDLAAQLSVQVRFLQIVNRSIGKLSQPLREIPAGTEPAFEVVDKLEVNGRTFASWQEAAEREIAVPALHIAAPSRHQVLSFEFPAGRDVELLHNDDGLIVGVVVREWQSLSGSVEMSSLQLEDDAIRVTVRTRNLTSGGSLKAESRADALMYSFISTHARLSLDGGEFVSSIDPPERLKDLVAQCNNIGCWPVLVGEEGDRDTMLASPIILYDYPQIAEESPGSLFDGTEIDEILSLRILTMTDEEKQEMRQSDQRASQILERTESMPPEQFMKLHGVLRGLRPVREAS
jgi:hypothetical protein